MGTGTLQSRLTWRLVVVVVLSLAAAALASLVAASHALDAAVDARCKAVAHTALRAFAHERGEGDAPAIAARIVVSELGTDDTVLHFAGYDPLVPPPSQEADEVDKTGPLPPADARDVREHFRTLPDAGCGVTDLGGHRWRGCAMREGEMRVEVSTMADDTPRVLETMASSMLAVLIAAALAGALAVRLALRGPLTAVARIAAWSKEVAGGSEVPLPVSDDDASSEIATLGTSIEHLVRSLAETLARERANSAHIAHEMRTPLTSIRAELGLLAERSPDPAILRLQKDSERLSRVIDSVLVLSSPRARARAEAPVNVADLVRQHAPANTVVDAPDEALVDADEHLLTLALTNLLENADKYGGAARLLRVDREGAAVRIGVVDHGAPLDGTVRERMFERYWRSSDEGDGIGIGLALVRAVAERHGGRADARNASDGGLDIGFTVAPVLVWHGHDAAVG